MKRRQISRPHWTSVLIEMPFEDVIELVSEHNEVVSVDITDMVHRLSFDSSQYFSTSELLIT